MNILLPTQITAAMIGAGTNIPAIDPYTGEVAWVSGTSYAVGDRRVDAGYVYECVQPVTSAPQNTYPPSDVRSRLYWLKDEGAPSNQMAPFDEYIYTAAKRKGEIKYILHPGFANGLAMHGVEADEVQLRVRDRTLGTELLAKDVQLWQQAFGEWEYLFGNLQRDNKYTTGDLPLHPAPEIEVRLIRNDPNVDAAVGFISVGQWQAMLSPGGAGISGTQYGAEVTPRTYSYFKRNDDGTYVRRQGRVAKVITASVLIDSTEAPRVEKLLSQILDVPVAIEASALPRYGHISTVGFVTGSVVAESWGLARVNIKVDGNI